MSKEEVKELNIMRRTLDKLYTQYDEAAADIAPPIKNIDGMPFSNTNDVTSPVELKAMRLMDLYAQIMRLKGDIMHHMKYLNTVNDPEVEEFLTLRYLQCMSWEKIKEITNSKKSTENIRKICAYRINIL